jgi:stage IV sporulation protein B
MNREEKRRYRIFLILLFILLAGVLGVRLVSVKQAADETNGSTLSESSVAEANAATLADDSDTIFAMPVGEPVGIYVKTDGVMVVNTGEVTGSDGCTYSPCQGKLQQGDYITSINGTAVEDKTTLVELVNEAEGADILMGVRRGDSEFYISVTPVKGKSNRYMLGVWVKDDISGIGTLTYITKDSFGALGHSINDTDTGTLLSVSDGAVFTADIINIRKPEGSQAGRLEGIIDYENQTVLGRITSNGKYGITGTVTEQMEELCQGREWMPVGKKEEVHTGSAYILSCVSGEPVYYEIQITRLSYSENNSEMGVGMALTITDENLIDLTGGIVQGMSGTPIIQDGKLVGAVTHVFLKDATKGYGVFIEDMMEQ